MGGKEQSGRTLVFSLPGVAGQHQFFKDKKSKRGHKTVGIKVFLAIFP